MEHAEENQTESTTTDWRFMLCWRGGELEEAWLPEGWLRGGPGEPAGPDWAGWARPPYPVPDPLVELDAFCSRIEEAPWREQWFALVDPEVRLTCGDLEFEEGWIGWNSFSIPGGYLQRLRKLGVRLVVTIDPPSPAVRRGLW